MKAKLFPPPEHGIHSWLFGRARYLRDEGLEETSALAELRWHVASSTFRAGRFVADREITDAITSAYRGTPSARNEGAATYDTVKGWPPEMVTPRGTIHPARLQHVLATRRGFETVDLWEQSPVRPPELPTPRWALTQLFSELDLLCVGRSPENFLTKPLREWTEAELLHQQFIVPNPSRKPVGTTKAGKESPHCRDAVGPRRYLIVESDAGLSTDEQAGVLEFLRTETNARLAAVILSGGKSLHGWFRCDNVPSERLQQWFEDAISVGADPRLWLPEQFVRLPDGLRDNNRRQALLYLNPTA